MKKLWELLKGKKSYIVASVAVLYAVIVVGWQGGDWHGSAQLVLAALGLGSVRHAIK